MNGYFLFYYITGAVVFFCHAFFVIHKNTKIISSQIRLSEDETMQLFNNYFLKILFQTLMMIILPLTFVPYFAINTHCLNKTVVSSGLLTIIWLLITGLLIRFVYWFVTCKTEPLKSFNCDEYFQDKEFFWIACTILYGILFGIYNYRIFFTILAIVLGKYIWMDSFKFNSLSEFKKGVLDIKVQIVEFYKKYKSDILLLLCQALVMGHLLLGWYLTKDDQVDLTHIIVIILLFFTPIIDLFIVISMKSYVRFIIKSRECIVKSIDNF